MEARQPERKTGGNTDGNNTQKEHIQRQRQTRHPERKTEQTKQHTRKKERHINRTQRATETKQMNTTQCKMT